MIMEASTLSNDLSTNLSTYAQEFLALALVHLLLVVIPGPDFAITLRQSVRFGHLAGSATALGVGSGISLHLVYTLLGVGVVMHTTPWLMNLVSLFGVGYLLYLGITLIRSQPSIKPLPEVGTDASDATEGSGTLLRSFMMGFMTNATNPKATLFFLSIFTTLVSSSTPLSVQIFYGAWMCSVNALWFILMSYIFSRAGIRGRFLRLGYWLERGMGSVLIVLALIYFERLASSVYI